MNIHIANKGEIDKAFALRFEVFVDEQNVPPEEEIDAEDSEACHIIAEDNGDVIGCARILFSEDDAHIGRLAVRKNERGKGVGAAICRFAMDIARDKGFSRIWLNAQCRAVGFYEKLGFKPHGEVFMDAGIEHIRMDLSESF